jgi:type II secretory pathway pseudopilin PulG
MMDGNTTTPGNATRIARGFTLVEMVIVIGVIILLAALTLSVSVAVVEGSEVRQTENTIRLLTAAIQEWEAQADRQVSFGINEQPYNQGERYEIQQPVNSGDLDQFVEDSHVATQWLFTIISRPSSVKQILAQVDPEFVEQGVVQDDAGNDVPGRTWADGYDAIDDRDSDGTLRADLEKMCGIAANRQICLISAGPDGEFGDLTQPPDTDESKLAKDNVYSYEPVDITAP